jgi:hypothetical protein
MNQSLGGHGKAASFGGSCGMACASEAEPMAADRAFANMGAKEGGPNPIPSRDMSGAFMPDESVRSYNGDPRKNT